MNLIDKIQKQVDDFKGKQFVAPYLGRNKIQVRINGLVLTLDTPDRHGILRNEHLNTLLVWETQDGKTARAIEKATKKELVQYLNLFPEVKLLVTKTEENRCWGIMSHTGTGKVRFDGEVPFVCLSEFKNFELFDEITARYDGQTFFFNTRTMTIPSDMVVAAWMRDELHIRKFRHDHQSALVAKHARPEHKQAFQVAWDHMMADAAGMIETILGNAVSHAGAKMQSYKEDEDTYAVTIEIDGVKQNPVVVSKDMEVLSAGICLHNEKIFDMQSLVSVLREGQRDEEDDW